MEHFDVLIVGAGLSGIDAAYHLQKFCPGKTYVILEQRERIGGTWDLFRYPGIRSDSDMFTMGYSFRPWTHRNSISDGDAIRDYITDTACSEGIDRHIRFRHRIQRVAWSSAEARWTVEAIRKSDGESAKPVRMTCGFLFCCAGYYRYDAGYTPEFPGIDRFAGRIVHPQAWPEDLYYAGKRVVIIGSGATAVTLLPAMAKTAAHVVMLPALAHVCRLPARTRCHRKLAALRTLSQVGLPSEPLEKHCVHDVRLSIGPALPGLGEERHHQEGTGGTGLRLRCNHPLRSALQPLGTTSLRRARR